MTNCVCSCEGFFSGGCIILRLQLLINRTFVLNSYYIGSVVLFTLSFVYYSQLRVCNILQALFAMGVQ